MKTGEAFKTYAGFVSGTSLRKQAHVFLRTAGFSYRQYAVAGEGGRAVSAPRPAACGSVLAKSRRCLRSDTGRLRHRKHLGAAKTFNCFVSTVILLCYLELKTFCCRFPPRSPQGQRRQQPCPGSQSRRPAGTRRGTAAAQGLFPSSRCWKWLTGGRKALQGAWGRRPPAAPTPRHLQLPGKRESPRRNPARGGDPAQGSASPAPAEPHRGAKGRPMRPRAPCPPAATPFRAARPPRPGPEVSAHARRGEAASGGAARARGRHGTCAVRRRAAPRCVERAVPSLPPRRGGGGVGKWRRSRDPPAPAHPVAGRESPGAAARGAAGEGAGRRQRGAARTPSAAVAAPAEGRGARGERLG